MHFPTGRLHKAVRKSHNDRSPAFNPYPSTWISWSRTCLLIRVARDRGVDFASIRFKKIPQHLARYY